MPGLKSLIAMSMHKAGSSIADLILTDFCNVKGYEIDRISNNVTSSPLPEGEYFKAYQARMRPTGVYYGMARGPYVREMDIIGNLKAIVQLRDPRDCITSAYFSYSTSHRPPENPEKRKAFDASRENLKKTSIDDYAKKYATNYRRRMRVLADIVSDHDDVLVLKYEDMVLDTEAWLVQISEFLEQPVTERLRETLGRKIDFTVDKEDASKQKRQVTPGDHARKLAPDTITAMNEVLGEQMAQLGYAL